MKIGLTPSVFQYKINKVMKKYLLLIIILPIILSMVSCATQLSNTNTKSYADSNMVVIPAGWFMMGSDMGEFNEKPKHDVYINTFEIDKFEVSAKDFAEFLNEKGNPDNKYFSLDEYSTITNISDHQNAGKDNKRSVYLPIKGFDNYPANNVSWYGAYDYCKWKGKRLPTEAEWEKTARGTHLNIYPWGNSLPEDSSARYGQRWQEQKLHVMVPVDAFSEGSSPYGVLNMTGNVLEWVEDWYRLNYCDFCDDTGGFEYFEVGTELVGKEKYSDDSSAKQSDVLPRKNPNGPDVGNFKVLRGGSWKEESEFKLRISFRYFLAPTDRQSNTGFRCAK